MTPLDNSLTNFFLSVKFRDPQLAERMADDVALVALHGLSADKTVGQQAADRLRHLSRDLPEILRRILEGALHDLGYS